jgi:lipid-A-disaccharide synthase
MNAGGDDRELRLFLVAGEHSGDALGGRLMASLSERHGGRLRFFGVGGEAMENRGLVSLFPLSDVAVMGPLAILARLPRLVRRVRETAAAAVAAEPDAIVIIDSPEFTHPIARRIRRRRRYIPIIDYVSPSVWAWRPGRAARMRRYVDHVLALLPFEPDAHARLGGPPCTYVGHPLIERLDWMRTLDAAPLAARLGLDAARPVLVVLPGSRPSEVGRLMPPFGAAVARLIASSLSPQVIIPAVTSVRPLIEAGLATWPITPHLVAGEDDKYRAFKLARAALAASGTVTLELALVGTPAVVAYRVDALAARLRFLLKVPSVVLANLVLDDNVYPEYLQEACTPENLAAAIVPLLQDTAERKRQLALLRRVPGLMRLPAGSPSEAAAAIVTSYLERARRSRD